MKFSSIYKKIAGLTAGLVLVAGISTSVVSAQQQSIPYQGADTPPASSPAFNVYTGTPATGDESDFFRGKVSSSTGYLNNVQSACAEGTKFTLRVYVHNGASQYANNNGSGPSVANNSKVSVNLNNAAAKNKFDMDSTISASNASSVKDGMTIDCGNKTVKLSYVAGSAQQYSKNSGTQKLNDSIVTANGAPIGTMKPDGKVYGCWDQTVWVTLEVVVKDVPKEEPKVAKAICEYLKVESKGGRTIRAIVQGDVEHATITGYRIDFGDGSNPVNQQTADYTYIRDGEFVIKGYVTVRYNAGTTRAGQTETLGGDKTCKYTVKFEKEKEPECKPGIPVGDERCEEKPEVPEEPETPVTEIPDLPATGPAGILLGAGAISALSALGHRFVTVRRLQK